MGTEADEEEFFLAIDARKRTASEKYDKVVAWSFVAATAFWALSLLAAGAGFADLFQRLGALGVAIGVLTFAFLRRAETNLAQINELEKDYNTTKFVADSSKEFFGIESPDFLQKRALEANMQAELRSKQTSRTETLEFVQIVLATLQWGFGDWVVSLLHCGFTKCSI